MANNHEELPRCWLLPAYVEHFCIIRDPGTQVEIALNTEAIDNVGLFIWLKQYKFPQLTTRKFRQGMRWLCKQRSNTTHVLREDLRVILSKRIEELGRKGWACTKATRDDGVNGPAVVIPAPQQQQQQLLQQLEQQQLPQLTQEEVLVLEEDDDDEEEEEEEEEENDDDEEDEQQRQQQLTPTPRVQAQSFDNADSFEKPEEYLKAFEKVADALRIKRQRQSLTENMESGGLNIAAGGTYGGSASLAGASSGSDIYGSLDNFSSHRATRAVIGTSNGASSVGGDATARSSTISSDVVGGASGSSYNSASAGASSGVSRSARISGVVATGSASASGASAHAAMTYSGGASLASASGGPDMYDGLDAFEPRTFNPHDVDVDDDENEEEEENDGMRTIDSEILDVLDNDNNNNEDEVALLELGKMFVSCIPKAVVTTSTGVENQYHALEKHYASCFKYPELMGFAMISKYSAVHFTPHTYANEQFIRMIGKDLTKEFHQPFTMSGMERATELLMQMAGSGDPPWVIRSVINIPFNCFEADGTKCIRYYNVWGTIQLFNDEHYINMFSPAGDGNDLLRQPGPFRPNAQNGAAAAAAADK